MKSKSNYCRELTNNYCVIDTETTGTSIYYDEVIEIGAIKVRDNKIVDTYQTLVKPNINIPADATAVNHITDDMVSDAPVIKDVIDSFLSFIGDDLLVGQNTSFDINILRNNTGCSIDNKYVCVEQMVKKLWVFENYKLDTVKNRFGIKAEAHRAVGDCEATNIIYELIKKELNDRNASIEDFYAKSKGKGGNKPHIKINDIEVDPNKFDPESPIYEHSFAFTGTLPFSRDSILEKVVKIGGHCHNKGAIANDTEFLVIGADFYKQWRKEKKVPSTKVQKALDKGIEILDSDTFMDMLNGNM